MRINSDGSYNLSDLHQRLDDLEYAGRIVHGGGRSLSEKFLVPIKESEHEYIQKCSEKEGCKE